jgi:hypothetical protein
MDWKNMAGLSDKFINVFLGINYIITFFQVK